jgi:GDP-D-mannose dehydratase
VEIGPKCMRPTEVDFLRADRSNARTALGWEPKVGFNQNLGNKTAGSGRSRGLGHGRA